MNDDWKRDCREEQKRRRLTNAELGRLVGTTGPNISMTLKPIADGGYHSSAYAMRIGEVLHQPLPGAPVDAKFDHAIALLQELRAMSDMTFDRQVAEIERLVEEQRRVVGSIGKKVPKSRNKRSH